MTIFIPLWLLTNGLSFVAGVLFGWPIVRWLYKRGQSA